MSVHANTSRSASRSTRPKTRTRAIRTRQPPFVKPPMQVESEAMALANTLAKGALAGSSVAGGTMKGSAMGASVKRTQHRARGRPNNRNFSYI